MSNAQNWTLLGMVTVLFGIIGGLLVQQVRALGDRFDDRFTDLGATIDAKFDAVDAKFDAVDAKFDAVDTRFDAVDQRFDHLDRDVQALIRDRFGRD